MSTPRKRNNSWVVFAFILSPIIWTIPTFFYLRAETRSHNNYCEFALKQFGLKLLTEYPATHDGRLPDAKNWVKALKDINQEIYRCPNDHVEHPVSYAMNANLSGKKISDIKNPGGVILMYETNGKQSTPFGVGKDLVDIGKDKAGQGRHNLVAYRFNYYLMADGTVRRAGTAQERKPLRWNP